MEASCKVLSTQQGELRKNDFVDEQHSITVYKYILASCRIFSSSTSALLKINGVPAVSGRKLNMASSIRSRVVQLYKNLLFLGREYPKGYEYFRSRAKASFMKNKDVKDSKELEILLIKGQYIIKELEALYMLKKYRTLKKRYYSEQ
ncbi:electron transfer flavoprotein regulatory factor 1 [Nephila pilipes]|uniref:Electron transfer flavoprotein regulatory factor 1 n=1 Tax=Nephila pilipes TaxID=299642 RepID=A0A8X6NC71_NEPPI|nr:electron transfer flavoprotein regulatory factor 1 [Nephila pilipes]